MKKLLKIVGLMLLSFVLLLLGAGIYFWHRPEGAVFFAISQLKLPLDIEGLNLDLDVHWPPRIGIELHARRARFTDSSTQSSYEAKRLRVHADLSREGFKISRLRAREVNLVLISSSVVGDNKTMLGELVGQIIDIGPLIERWKPTHAKVRNIHVRVGDQLSPTVDVKGSLRCFGRRGICRIRGDLKLPIQMKVVLNLEAPGDAILKFQSFVRSVGWNAELKGLFVNPNEAQILISGRYIRPLPIVPQADVVRCEIRAYRKSDTVIALNDCLVRGTFRDPRIQATRVDVLVAGAMDENLSGNVSIAPRTYRNNWVDMKGTIHANFDLDTPTGEPTVEIRRETAFLVQLQDVRVLIALLTDLGIPVFAPIHTFDGSLSLEVPPTTRSDMRGFELPFIVRADLGSNQQNLDFIMEGSIGFKAHFEKGRLEGDLRITAGRLQLPPRAVLQKIPEAMPDSRLQMEVPPDEDPDAFQWSLRIRTEGNPIGLRADIFKKDIPLGLDVVLGSNGQFSGDIRIHPVALSLFRRAAEVEGLTVRIPPEKSLEFSKLDGTVRVDYPDYTIRIFVTGSPVKPRVFFVSDPPLTQDQIIAVLLYGEVPEELGSGEQESVNQVSSAVTRQSLTLASMYLFASTPVQSVSFDPATDTLSARFKLGDKTSLNVESQTETKSISEVALSRRIGDRWAITTELPLGEKISDVRGVRTFLDWFLRY